MQTLSYQDLPRSLDMLTSLASRSPSGNEAILQALEQARKAGLMGGAAIRPLTEIPGVRGGGEGRGQRCSGGE